MGKIITVFSHKGGVGKTTLVHNLGYILADKGKRVLLIDADPQMNLTSAVAGLATNTQYTTEATNWQNFLSNNTNLALYIKGIADGQGSDSSSFYKKPTIYTYRANHKKTGYRAAIKAGDVRNFKNNGKLYLLPSSIGFNDAIHDVRLSILPKIEFQLSAVLHNSEGFSSTVIFQINHRLRALAGEYDFILIDTSPSASSLLNGLLVLSSDYLLIPAKPDFFSLQAIDNMQDVFNNWGGIFKPWFSTPNVKGLAFPRLLGIVPQMTKRFAGEASSDDGYAQRSVEWNSHMNLSIIRFLRAYLQSYDWYNFQTTIETEKDWFLKIYPNSNPFIIQECVHYTGRLRTVAENAAIPVVFLDNAIASENEFHQAIFDNLNITDNQYALAFQSIKLEYNNIADGLLRL